MRFIIYLADGRAYPVEHVRSAELTPEATTLRYWSPVLGKRVTHMDGAFFNIDGQDWDRTIVRVEVL